MSALSVAAGVLVGLAVALVVVCALGVAVMGDPYQRLHYLAPPTSIAAGLIVLAVWLNDRDWQADLKSLLVLGALGLMNGVLTHATARATRLRHQLPTGRRGSAREDDA